MAHAFKSDIDGIAQTYLRDPVNNVLNPFSTAAYPPYCRTEPLTIFDRDPLSSHPSFYGVIANDLVPQSLHVRDDAITLGNEYGNIVRCRYGQHTLNGLVGGGVGYFACRDFFPPLYDPSIDPEVDKLAVGHQGAWYGYSNGPPVDDGVLGTDTNTGSINGLNTTNDRVRLSNWGCDYCGTNADGRLYFRLNRSNRSANGWAVTIYDQNYKVIGNGLALSRADVSNGYAYVMAEPFDLSPYVNQYVYIRIRATAPQLTIPPDTSGVQRAVVADMLSRIGYIGGTLFKDGPGTLYQSAYAVVAALANTSPIVDLTTYAVSGPTLPPGTNRFFVGTGNGFTGFSDGGGVDDSVAGTNATCGLLDGANITDRSLVGNWICNYFGSNSTGFLYIRLRNVSVPADVSLTLYDEQYGIIVVGKLENRGPRDAWYLPTPFNLTPYLNRTIYVKVTADPI